MGDKIRALFFSGRGQGRINESESMGFATERLFLREITEEDTERLVRWRADPKVYCFFRLPHALTKEEHLKWFREIYLVDDRQISFIVIEKKSQEKIGIVGIKRVESDCAEVSYLLDKTAQGKGYATEAVQKLIEFSTDYWNCTRVVAEIHRKNHASIRMIQKLGFQKKSSQGDFEMFESKWVYLRKD